MLLVFLRIISDCSNLQSDFLYLDEIIYRVRSVKKMERSAVNINLQWSSVRCAEAVLGPTPGISNPQ